MIDTGPNPMMKHKRFHLMKSKGRFWCGPEIPFANVVFNAHLWCHVPPRKRCPACDANYYVHLAQERP